jgi:hypothetical protein
MIRVIRSRMMADPKPIRPAKETTMMKTIRTLLIVFMGNLRLRISKLLKEKMQIRKRLKMMIMILISLITYIRQLVT